MRSVLSLGLSCTKTACIIAVLAHIVAFLTYLAKTLRLSKKKDEVVSNISFIESFGTTAHSEEYMSAYPMLVLHMHVMRKDRGSAWLKSKICHVKDLISQKLVKSKLNMRL